SYHELKFLHRCALRFDVWYAGLLSHAGSQRHEAEERNQSPHWHVEESIVLTQIMSASSANRKLARNGVMESLGGLVMRSSINGKVKKKHFSRGWNFSTFAAHLIEQDLF